MVWRSSGGWEDDLESKPAAAIIKMVVIAVAVVLILTAGIWGLFTGFSYWWGHGNAVQDRNSATTFEQSQALFHRDYNQVVTDRAKIASAQDNLDAWKTAHPGYTGNGTPYDPTLDDERNLDIALNGIKDECLAEVTDYDNASQSFLSANWRDAGMPPSLDPLTACDPAKPLPAG